MSEEGTRTVVTQSKLPIPRQLLDTETFESLKHWKNCFRKRQLLCLFLEIEHEMGSYSRELRFYYKLGDRWIKKVTNWFKRWWPYSFSEYYCWFPPSQLYHGEIWAGYDMSRWCMEYPRWNLQCSNYIFVSPRFCTYQIPRVIDSSSNGCLTTLGSIWLKPTYLLMDYLLVLMKTRWPFH